MYSIKPGGLYGEAGVSMEVTDKCYNTGDVVGVEAPFCWNVVMVLGAKGEGTELGNSGFSPTTEYDRVILGKTVTDVFSKSMRQL